MGKDKSTKERKEKKEKRSDKDGVKKSKKDKKSKLSDENIAAAVKVVSDPESPSQENEDDDMEVSIVKDGEAIAEIVGAVAKPIGALVPFANPLADEKVAKKVLKGVKKG